MKFEIDQDELYPFYTMWEDTNGIEVDSVFAARYNKVMAEFKQLQQELLCLYKQQEGN